MRRYASLRTLRRGTVTARATASALAPVLLLTALLAWPSPTAGAQAPNDRRPSKLEGTVDPTVKPGDDFFAYANGAWLKSAAIPAGKERWAARDELNALTRLQIATLFDNARTQLAGSTARKVADFRAAYLNEAAIEAKGLAPLKPQIDSIDRVHDRASLTRLLGAGLLADVDPLHWGVYKSSHILGLSVEPSIHGEKTYVAFLVQGGLGLPDRENYISTEPRMLALRTKYQEYVTHMLTLAGSDRADQRAASVLKLESALAKSQATREASSVDRNADTVWTRADFARRAPGMDWNVFFTAAKLVQQDTFVAWQPSALTGVAALVASQPLETWKDYLRFHLVDRYADVLPRAYAEPALALRDAAASTQPSEDQHARRAQRALDATQLAMGGAIGKMYAERYFPADQKARVQAIVSNVTTAFVKRVEAVTWMSPATKTQTLAKLKTLYVGVGYPEHWQDYSDLVVDPLDALGNQRRAANRDYRQAVARVGKPIDMTEWGILPQTVGGILVFQENQYDVTAALMQAPKFDPTASDAANYGAIGALVGHDVTHFVDVLGSDYEADGRMRHWWTSEDMSRFQAVVQPLVSQFSAYQPFPDTHINGKLTQSENIADLGGLAAAFDAYRRTLGTKANDKDYVRQKDREFFIGFAHAWRTKISDAAMRTQAATNDHAPEMYRISTVRNLDAWYDAFDVQPGQRLYLEPKARVRIW